MNATFFLLPLAAVLMLMMPLVPIYKGVTTGQKAKHAVIFNLCAFFGVAALMIILPMGGFVTLAEGASAAAESGMTVGAGLAYLAAALVTSFSCIGAGIAVAAAAPAAIGPYSQGIDAGSIVITSGQLPVDPATGAFAEGGIAGQTRQSLLNVQAVLAQAGLTMENVIKTTVFLKDMNDFAAMNEVYAGFFPGNPPARSAVEVARLPKDAMVEIEAIAAR